MLLEKQGRCSQKIRSNQMSNLAHVTQTVGQNMTDISNIGGNKVSILRKMVGIIVTVCHQFQVPSLLPNITQQAGGILPPRKDRGSSLPPSALPRPPRSLKPPRKIEYGRLSDSEGKKRAETPPKSDAQKDYEMKTSSLKRASGGNSNKREFSPGKSYLEMKDSLQLVKDYGSMKTKNYGSLGNTSMAPSLKSESKFGFGSKSNASTANSCEFSKPDYTSTKNYQRLEEQSPQSRKSSADSGTMKRSLLPNVRKLSSGQPVKGSRDSLNSASSGSNNSNNSNQIFRSSPVHSQAVQQSSLGYHHHNHLHHGRTPPRFIHHLQSTSVESNKSSHNLPSPQSPTSHQQPFFGKMSQNSSSKLHPMNNQQPQQQHKPSALPSASILHAAVTASATSAIGQQTTASLPPKPVSDNKGCPGSSGGSGQRRGSSLTRGENKYRIQF